MTRRELLDAHRQFYSNALARKWQKLFHTETGPCGPVTAGAVNFQYFVCARVESVGVSLLGMETRQSCR